MSDAVTMEEVRDRIVLAALPHVPFEGWHEKALQAASVAAGYDASMAERVFSGGALAAVEHFSALADRQLMVDAAAMPVDARGMTAKIAWLVRRRIEPWSAEREAVRRALALFCLPANAPAGVRANWRTADMLWYAAGDQASDFSYYTKRMTLAAIYGATVLFWLDDRSDDGAATWEFLARRLEGLKYIPKMKSALRKATDAWTRPLSDLLVRGNLGRNAGRPDSSAKPHK